MKHSIAVLYLARLAEGFAAFERFAASYRKCEAGEPHDLVIVAKGFDEEKPGQLAGLEAIFTGIPHKIIQVPDDVGLDIHAYREACLEIDHDTICCLNTFTRLRTDFWLQKLNSNFKKSGVGIVGATGSYESLYSSYKVIQQVVWSYPRSRTNVQVAKRFKWLLAANTPNILSSWRLRARRMIGDLVHRRPSITRAAVGFEHVWAAALEPGAPFHSLRDFPAFPNPHVRSNVFMVSRRHFLSVELNGKTKLACCRFESGPAGLTTMLRRRGLRPLIVGADGVGYELSAWPASNCFRSGDQGNLLADDNQTAVFSQHSTAEERETLLDMTWAGYRSQALPREMKIFGVPFNANHRIDSVLLDIKRDTSRQRLFSIVIPCRNRGELAADTIKTVLNQGYQNVEICVFDNASTVPVASFLPRDPRIRLERSDEPLHVTASWNRAVDMAIGEYVTLIGDDDGLLPGFFDRVSALADHFGEPDVVLSNLYQFIHPGVSPNDRSGFVSTLTVADFLNDVTEPFLLPRSEVTRSVNNSLNFRRSFLFNMPAYTVRRSLLDAIRHDGKVLRSPFPDYYFANVILEKALKIVCEPRSLAYQGVSKTSFGSSMFNSNIDAGFKELGANDDPIRNALQPLMLSISRYHDEYLVTMAHLADAIGDPGRRPDIDRYRKIQIFQCIRDQGLRASLKLYSGLALNEKVWALSAAVLRSFLGRTRYLRFINADIERKLSLHLFQQGQTVLDRGSYVKGSDVFNAFAVNELQVSLSEVECSEGRAA